MKVTDFIHADKLNEILLSLTAEEIVGVAPKEYIEEKIKPLL